MKNFLSHHITSFWMKSYKVTKKVLDYPESFVIKYVHTCLHDRNPSLGLFLTKMGQYLVTWKGGETDK